MAVRRQEDVMREFINEYQCHPCLWKIKCNEYMDKNKKEEALQKLADILKEIIPDADINIAKKKINSMRSCFRKEYKKMIDSQRSGAGSDSIYTPTLWYFNLLLFLKDQEIPRSSIGNDEPNFATTLESENESEIELQIESPASEIPATPSTSRDSSVSRRSINRQRKNKKMDGDNILQIVGEKLQNSRVEDEFDVVGRNVAEKMRKLDPMMRVFAEKLINDALFEAQLKTLNRNAYIGIPQPSQTNQYAGQSYPNFQTINSGSNITETSARQYYSQFSE